MKTLLLISSLFYLLGLKISHTIDIFKANHDKEPIIMEHTAVKPEDAKTTSYNKEIKPSLIETDSTSVKGSSQTLSPNMEGY